MQRLARDASFVAASRTDGTKAGRTSSRRISPGCDGGIARLSAMIILQFNCFGGTRFEGKRNPPISCHMQPITLR